MSAEKIIVNKGDLATLIQIFDPFLMIDGISALRKNEHAVSYKRVNRDSWFITSHLPDSLVMPGTLLVEGMLQTLVALIYLSVDHKGSVSYVTDMRVKLIRPVRPGDEIVYFADLISAKRGIFKGSVIGKVANLEVCSGAFTYATPNLFPTHNFKQVNE